MVRVRLATEEDYNIIVDFQLKMAKETEDLVLNKALLTKGVRAVFLDPKKGKYLVAEAEEQVVASMLITHEWSDWRNKWIFWLQSVYVIPAYRGKGVFKELYMHIKRLTEADSRAGGIRLYVDKTNENAAKVYHAVGMNGEHYQLFEWMKPTDK